MSVCAGIALSEETMGWLLDLSFDDQDNYLKIGNPVRDYDDEWPDTARERATMCREISEAVRSVGEAARWEELARAYEESAGL